VVGRWVVFNTVTKYDVVMAMLVIPIAFFLEIRTRGKKKEKKKKFYEKFRRNANMSAIFTLVIITI